MPRPETNHRITRYREHRQALTRFSKSQTLAPRYAFFAELIMLWLDCKNDQEDRIWDMITYYVKSAGKPSNRYVPDTTTDTDLDESPSARAKDKMKELLDEFLATPPEELED